jgi:hypothetical protein
VAENRKTLVLILAAAGLALLGIAGFAAASWWRDNQFQKTWDSRIAQLQDSGIPTDRDEFFAKAPPDEKNAALLIEQAVERHKELKESVDSDFNPFSPGGSEWKDVAPDSERRAEVFEAWSTPRMQELLQLVRRAALRTDFHVERDYSSPLTMDLEPVTSMLSLGQLLYVRGDLLAHEGRVQEAWEIIPVLFRLSDFASSEPMLICMLVGMSIERMALAAIENILQQPSANDLSVAQLEEMSAVLASREPEVFPKAIWAIDGERVLFGGAIFAMMRDRKTSMAEIIRQAAAAVDLDMRRNYWLEVAGFLYTQPLRFFLSNDQLAWLDFHQRFK